MTKTHQFDVSEPLPADEMLISTRVGLSRRAQANLSRAKDILTSKEMKDVKTEDIFRAWLEEYDPPMQTKRDNNEQRNLCGCPFH